MSAWYGRRIQARALKEERETTVAGLLVGGEEEVPRVSPGELNEILSGMNPPLVLDVHSCSAHQRDGAQVPGSVRVLPDRIIEWAAGQPTDRDIVAYCPGPDEATSARVAQQLRTLGFNASVLQGGFDAWRAQYPVEQVSYAAA